MHTSSQSLAQIRRPVGGLRNRIGQFAFWLAKLLLALFSLSGVALAQQPGEQRPPSEYEQQRQSSQICAEAYRASSTPSPQSIAQTLGSLTGYHRSSAARCLIKDWSSSLSASELRDIVGSGNDGWRRGDICYFSRLLPDATTAQELVILLQHLEGEARAWSIGCLLGELPSELAVVNALDLLGPLVMASTRGPAPRPYDPEAHRYAVCAIAGRIEPRLDADAIAALLGAATGQTRWNQVNCLREKIAQNLNWDGVYQIVGSTSTYRGGIVDALGSASPDGANYTKLQALIYSLPNRQTILSSADPENNWTGGQCVAWAKLAFANVSAKDMNVEVGVARNIASKASGRGLETETDATRARVGSLVVWDNGDAGHVGIVTRVVRDNHTGAISRIFVVEANWGEITQAGAQRWGLSLEEARREFVTERYGSLSEAVLDTSQLDRTGADSSYRFMGYVHPAEMATPQAAAPVVPRALANAAPPAQKSSGAFAATSPATPSTFACTPSQRQLAADLRSAYGGNMEHISAVARDADYALLASAVYQGTASLQAAGQRGWTQRVADMEQSLLSGSMEYSVFERGDEIVVAFQGTNGALDWVTNATVVVPLLPKAQIQNAERVADHVTGKYPDKRISFVGHSLGGRLAQVAALHTGREAVVFDSSPLSRDETPSLPERLVGALQGSPTVRAYRGPQDPLSAIDSRRFEMGTIVVSNIVKVDDKTLPGLSHLDFTHSHEVLAKAMEEVRQTYVTGGFDCPG